MKRALFSLYKKDGAEGFASFLAGLGYEILSTGGTYRYLKEKGIPVTEVSEATGFPEVLDGRVKTLHPVIHAGILAIRDNKEHRESLKAHNIAPVDFVVVNLYPFEDTVKNPNSALPEIIEQIDIGGVALIRAAAKNYQDVAIVVDNTDFALIQAELEKNGRLSPELRVRLAAKAFSHTGYYDSLIAGYFNRLAGVDFPQEFGVPLKQVSGLRYGENPHQRAALYASGTDSSVSALAAEVLHGKEMSYNNYLDADAVIDILREFEGDKPFAVIIKHNNPCGAALSGSLEDAFLKAKAVDPVSAYGGIIGVNHVMDKATADRILETFFEIVVAPAYEPEALDALKTKKNLRILKLPAADWAKKGLNMRRIEGGFLVQDFDSVGMGAERFEVVSEKAPEDGQTEDLRFAWNICKYVKSNAIVFAKGGQLYGVGAGQMSRVDSVRIAVQKAGDAGFDIKGAVMASDAFFPFRDSVDAAAKVGISAIIQPGGSVNDKDSIAAANENGMALVLTGVRHFRH